MADPTGPKKDNMTQLAEKIIDAAKKMHVSVGTGFSEAIYEKELAEHLTKHRLAFAFKPVIKVRYDDFKLSGQKVDFIVEDKVLVDVVCKSSLSENRQEMLVNLKVAGKKLGLVINFGKPEFEHNVVHADGKGVS